MEDCCIILNPQARGARRLQVADQLRDAARGAKLCITSAPGEAMSLAREAAHAGYRTVVAGGGDGTVNEVLCGIVNTSARLGVLPLGTMNVFAREIGLSMDWEEALAVILKGRERTLDLGWANDRPMAQLGGVGFDAEVVAGVSSGIKRLFGPGAYAWSAAMELGRPLPDLRVQAEGLEETSAAWVLVGQGRLYGGPVSVFPRASMGDGLLDVLLVRDLRALSAVQYLAGLPLGWHTRMKGVEYLQTSRLRVSGDAAVEVDGEIAGRAPVEFSVQPSALRLVA